MAAVVIQRVVIANNPSVLLTSFLLRKDLEISSSKCCKAFLWFHPHFWILGSSRLSRKPLLRSKLMNERHLQL